MKKQMNLLFVMTDHQRCDTINMIQCGRAVTPHLNELASTGAWFERAYTTCPLCVPARTALATGVYPTESGVVYNDWENKTALNMTTVHDILKENGYQVGYVGVDHIKVIPPLRSRGYDYYYCHEEYEKMAKERGMVLKEKEDIEYVQEMCDGELELKGYSGIRISEWEYPIQEFKDFCFLQHAEKFLNSVKEDRPFALFVYLWAPHPPLRVPEPYAGMYDPDSLVLPDNIGIPAHHEPRSRRLGAAAQLAAHVELEQWKKVWAAHLGLTSLADDLIGRLLERLNRMGKRNNTAIFFTADHGENLGQHGLYQKMEMYEECIHVPLFINLPSNPPVVVKEPVSHLDLAPTICEMIGDNSRKMEGRSLLSAVKGRDIYKRELVFSQYSGTYGYGFIRRAVITEDEKYIYDEGGEKEYFRLKEDPHEMHNLAYETEYSERVEQLHTICRTYHKEHGDYFKWNSDRNGGDENELV